MNSHYEVIEDALSELSMICVERASSALSQLMGHKGIKSTTSFSFGAQDALWENYAQSSEKAIGVLLLFSKDIHGMMLFIFHRQFIEELLWRTMHKTLGPMLVSDELTLIEETASILSSVYLETLSSYIHTNIKIHMPSTVFDMEGAIINDALSFMVHESHLLQIEHRFHLEGSKEENQILFLLDEASTQHMVQTLEVV